MIKSGKILWSGKKAGVLWEVLSLEQSGVESRYLINGNGKMQSGISLDAGGLYPSFTYAQAMVLEAMHNHSNILMLGAGGFSISTCILQHSSSVKITVVDIEGWLEEIAHQYLFKPRTNRLEFLEGNAEVLPPSSAGPYDLILIDLFTSEGLVPKSLFNPSFISRIKSLLAPNGSMIWNTSMGREPRCKSLAGEIRTALLNKGIASKAFSHPSQINYPKTNVLFIHNLRTSIEESGWVRFTLANG
jgi:spermidine synthase